MGRIKVLAIILTLTGSVAHAVPRASGDQAIGVENHPKILAQQGGVIKDAQITRYVNDLGRSLVAHSDQPNDAWTFTVLNTPNVNAFAIPGGYVYVTRGLLALANDEGELSAVLAHEIAHVTADHIGTRDEAGKDALRNGLFGAILSGLFSDGEDRLGNAIKTGVEAAVGYMGQFSQGQELEADKLGIQIMVRAGRDPYAAADFLDNLVAKHELESLISGKEYNPNNVSFFASHPATGDRVREAIRTAQRVGEPRDRDPRSYLEVIDGITYGDVASQGFVRRQAFLHPVLRFAFVLPDKFVITNTSNSVRAKGPNGATFVFSGDSDQGSTLTEYIKDVWAPQIEQKENAQPLRNLRRMMINGMDAATAILPVQTTEGIRLIQLTVIRRENQLFRISGVSKEHDTRTRSDLMEAAKSFQTLAEWEADLLTPYRVIIHKVRRRDTVERLAAQMPFDSFQIERFRTLNGLSPDDALQYGDFVKLIVE